MESGDVRRIYDEWSRVAKGEERYKPASVDEQAEFARQIGAL